MKLKATYKEIRQSGRKIISLGYCQAQNLLRHKSPFAYSCGLYGWNCDYYELGDYIISTGYRPIGNYTIDYKTIQTADNISLEIYNERVPEKEETRRINNIIKALLSEVKEDK